MFKAILSGNQQDESAYEQSPIIELADINNEEAVVGEETPNFPVNTGKYLKQQNNDDDMVEEEIKVSSPKKLIKSNKDHIVMSGVSQPKPVKDNSR